MENVSTPAVLGDTYNIIFHYMNSSAHHLIRGLPDDEGLGTRR